MIKQVTTASQVDDKIAGQSADNDELPDSLASGIVLEAQQHD